MARRDIGLFGLGLPAIQQEEIDMKPIPKPVLGVLGSDIWQIDEYTLDGYAGMLERHQPKDTRDGCTCSYLHWEKDSSKDPFTTRDMRDLASVAPAGMVEVKDSVVTVNQHFEHSIAQFMANCQHQWQLHLDRMDAIGGTPSARIHRKAA